MSAVAEAFHCDGSSMRTSWGRARPPTSEMKVGAPLSIAKLCSIQLLRTVISRPYTR
jgi:hypothetical protein